MSCVPGMHLSGLVSFVSKRWGGISFREEKGIPSGRKKREFSGAFDCNTSE